MNDYYKKYTIDKTSLIEFLESTQKEMIEEFKSNCEDFWENEIVKVVYETIEKDFLIHILGHGIRDWRVGKIYLLNSKFNIENEEQNELYKKNIYSVIDELEYEDKENNNKVDLALFLKGLPVSMCLQG